MRKGGLNFSFVDSCSLVCLVCVKLAHSARWGRVPVGAVLLHSAELHQGGDGPMSFLSPVTLFNDYLIKPRSMLAGTE